MKKYPKNGTDYYFPILTAICEEPSEDGVLSALLPKKSVFVASDILDPEDHSDDPIWLIQRDAGANDRFYAVVFLQNDYYRYYQNWTLERAYWQLELQNGQVIPRGIYYDAADGMLQKGVIDYTQYENVQFVHSYREPKMDENGEMLPFDSWKGHGVLYTSIYPALGFRLSYQDIPDPENYLCQFVIHSSDGSSYATELLPLAP